MNKKRIIMAAGLITVATLSMGAFSYFTDYHSKELSTKAGTLETTVTGDTKDLTDGRNILSPGDSNPFQFTVNNTGSKSADVKAVITVTAQKAFTEADHEYKITDKTGTELTGILSSDKKTITYTADDIVLKGSVENTTSDGTASNHLFDYKFAMDEDAGNVWQGADVKVNFEVFAKQHRNTSNLGNSWTQIVEKN